jgi:hypothetical protein
MSQPYTANIPPAVAGDLKPEWIAQVRGIVEREGYALRAGFPAITIEVQNINQPDVWQPLNLQTNTAHFATEQDRDTVLESLVGKAAR